MNIGHIRRYALAALLVSTSGFADELPAEVQEFLERAELCHHFRGEEPFDEQRAAYLEKMILETCLGNLKTLQYLRHKHHGSEEIMQILAAAESDYEIEE